MLFSVHAFSHHVSGRPAYSLNEDSNKPPSMNVETQIGNYFVTTIVYPAFPKPQQPGLISLNATHLDTAQPLRTEVTFMVRDDSWFTDGKEKLGTPAPDDDVYQQGFEFSKVGNYIITAKFKADGEPYSIDFPLRVGNPLPVWPLIITVAVIIFVQIGVSSWQRKRLLQAKLQTDSDEQEKAS